MTQVTGWRKSSRSHQETHCVEIGRLDHGGAAVRDTKDRTGGYIATTYAQWGQFITAVKSGRLL